MIKILYKINEFRKSMLIVCSYYLLKKHAGFDLIEVANILKEAIEKVDSLVEATRVFNNAAQRYNNAIRGFRRDQV